jgi:hypothetical protein
LLFCIPCFFLGEVRAEGLFVFHLTGKISQGYPQQNRRLHMKAAGSVVFLCPLTGLSGKAEQTGPEKGGPVTLRQPLFQQQPLLGGPLLALTHLPLVMTTMTSAAAVDDPLSPREGVTVLPLSLPY